MPIIYEVRVFSKVIPPGFTGDDYVWLDTSTGRMYKFNPTTGQYDLAIPFPVEITMDEELAAALANIELLPGPKGDTGEQGLPGVDGAVGEQGVKGDQGETGLKGDTGDTGLQGEQGLQGEPGAKGDKGDDGEQGLSGADGLPGIQGEQGIPGVDGVDGSQGLPGEQGIQGLPGEDGAQGEQGIQGYPGEAGAKGETGETGSQGIQGVPGETGAKGDTGLTGDQGIQGIQGIQGNPGTPGADGADGFPILVVTLFQDAALSAWTNMPAALTEFRAVLNTRTKIDLTTATQSRITVRKAVAASVNAKIKVQYSTNESTWVDLCLVALNTTANVTHIGTWTNVPAGAKADVFIRVVGIDGDGVADPSFGLITLQVK